ncbi:MAG: protease HtpX [Fimbriimonadaceae bacterium]|nr:protease HtpX [Fimbriimonadaceae bacterium]
MNLGKRILLFVATNIAVIAMLTLVLFLLQAMGVDLGRYGSVGFDAVVAVVIGFSGAFLSLWASKWIAKTMMGVRILNPGQGLHPYDQWIVETVHNQAKAAGLSKMPEVGIYDSPEVNAFATGPSKKNSLVAFSSGLLATMDRDAVEGVSAHEVGHIANGDMVTMTLIQGVINTFVIFLARIIARVVASMVREELGLIVFYVTTIALQIVFGILGSLITSAFSRYREYRADAFSAKISGKEKMIHALESLRRTVDLVDTRHPAMAAFKISNKSAFMRAFSTHPDIEDRIAALRKL